MLLLLCARHILHNNLPVSGNLCASVLPSLDMTLLGELPYHQPSPIHQLPTTIYQLPSTNYQLPSTNYHLPSTIYQLPTTNYHLPTTIYQLPTTNYTCPRLMMMARTATSAGFTPGMRDACASVSGRNFLSFSRLSKRTAVQAS